ncbi:4240_t:CDS:2, partial [Dentiscutata heterogama]
QFDKSSNIVNTNNKSLTINSYTFRKSSKQCLAHEVYISQADLQKTNSFLTRSQILSIINSLIPLVDDTD